MRSNARISFRFGSSTPVNSNRIGSVYQSLPVIDDKVAHVFTHFVCPYCVKYTTHRFYLLKIHMRTHGHGSLYLALLEAPKRKTTMIVRHSVKNNYLRSPTRRTYRPKVRSSTPKEKRNHTMTENSGAKKVKLQDETLRRDGDIDYTTDIINIDDYPDNNDQNNVIDLDSDSVISRISIDSNEIIQLDSDSASGDSETYSAFESEEADPYRSYWVMPNNTKQNMSNAMPRQDKGNNL